MVSDQSLGCCWCLREELIAAPRVHVSKVAIGDAASFRLMTSVIFGFVHVYSSLRKYHFTIELITLLTKCFTDFPQ